MNTVCIYIKYRSNMYIEIGRKGGPMGIHIRNLPLICVQTMKIMAHLSEGMLLCMSLAYNCMLRRNIRHVQQEIVNKNLRL